jgi:hypothetical protein
VNGNTVNEGNEAFYPRNVIFNKYFNKHNICVITPNAIMSNSTVSGVGADLTSVDRSEVRRQVGDRHQAVLQRCEFHFFAASLASASTPRTSSAVTDDNGAAQNVLTNSEGQSS